MLAGIGSDDIGEIDFHQITLEVGKMIGSIKIEQHDGAQRIEPVIHSTRADMNDVPVHPEEPDGVFHGAPDVAQDQTPARRVRGVAPRCEIGRVARNEGMDPILAAQAVADLDPAVAAAILAAMKPRSAARILNGLSKEQATEISRLFLAMPTQ